MNTAAVALDRKTCQEVAAQLQQTLADTYVLYLKTQNCHWNVIDPRFHSLHELFEQQYEELADAVDVIAERIRMIRGHTNASMRDFLKITSIKEMEGQSSGDEMLRQLLSDNEQMANYLRGFIDMCNNSEDAGTADMLIQRLRAHEKAAWMLRSHFS